MSSSSDKAHARRLKTSYHFDAYLMHLIQEVTKRPSAEIVNFFYEFTSQVCQIGVSNAGRHQRSIRKNIIDYFPGTSIPFHILVKGLAGYGGASDLFNCRADIGFPKERTYMNEEYLKDIAVGLMEKSLLGGDEVVIPDFPKPEISSGKMFKSFINEFMNRPKEEKKTRKKKEE